MVPNHEIELSKYIDRCRDKPFKLGSHDCMIFASECVKIQTGQDVFSDFRGAYSTPLSALIHYRAKAKGLGYPEGASVVDILSDRLTQFDGRYPPRGCITARNVKDKNVGADWMLGVRLRRYSAFLSPEGMIFLEREPSDLFWSAGQ
tara:strand:- start:2940 stop:3380 length:441 start_codon:yes stop_codon:yes gene_type:complete